MAKFCLPNDRWVFNLLASKLLVSLANCLKSSLSKCLCLNNVWEEFVDLTLSSLSLISDWCHFRSWASLRWTLASCLLCYPNGTTKSTVLTSCPESEFSLESIFCLQTTSRFPNRNTAHEKLLVNVQTIAKLRFKSEIHWIPFEIMTCSLDRVQDFKLKVYLLKLKVTSQFESPKSVRHSTAFPLTINKELLSSNAYSYSNWYSNWYLPEKLKIRYDCVHSLHNRFRNELPLKLYPRFWDFYTIRARSRCKLLR